MTVDAQIQRYRLLERIGEGGMGVVHRAFDLDLDRMVALKLVRAAKDPLARERLLREGRAIARLNHPNVVKVHEVGMLGDEVFLAMELVEGTTLRAWLGGAPRPWSQVLPVMLEAGRGLAAAHGAGLVHRDFKPANVLLAEGTSRVLVADFGLARASGLREPSRPAEDEELAASPDDVASEGRVKAELGGVTEDGTVVGTPAYMAPEQFLGETPSPRADQFAFCVVLWEALHGVRPFSGESTAVLLSNIAHARVGERSGGGPRWLDKVLRRGLRADPRERFASMLELLAALERGPVVARRRLWAASTTLVVGAAAGLGFAQTANTERRCAAESKALVAPLVDATAAANAAFIADDAPWIATSWSTIAAALELDTRAMAMTWAEQCEAAFLRAELPEASAEATHVCLQTQARQLDAWLGVLARGDRRSAERAVDALAILGQPADCRDPEHGDPPSALVLSGRALVGFARWDEAIEVAEAAVLDGEGPRASLVLAEALAGAGDLDRAREAAADAAAQGEASADDTTVAAAWVQRVAIARRSATGPGKLLALARAADDRARRDPRRRRALAVELVHAALANGDVTAARAELAGLLEVGTGPRGDLERARALELAAEIDLVAERRAEAASSLAQALGLASARYGPGHPRVVEIGARLSVVAGDGTPPRG